MNMQFAYEVATVTPELAEQWLESNTNNRRPRPGTIVRYAAMMTAGQWMLSPEALIFSTAGVLLNGQHRLLAVIKSGQSIDMIVCRNVPADVFRVLDRNAMRSAADALGIPKGRAEVARFAAMLCKRDLQGRNDNQVTDEEIGILADVLSDESDLLEAACPTRRKYFTTAPFRLAAIVRVMSGTPRDYVHSVYGALAHGAFEGMPPIVMSLVGQFLNGKVKARGGAAPQIDSLARAWTVMDPARADVARIQINDALGISKLIGELINPFDTQAKTSK